MYLMYLLDITTLFGHLEDFPSLPLVRYFSEEEYN